MILSVGEILCDLIGETEGGVTSFKRYAGGAPFNVACNACFAGASAGFIGRVGRDINGQFLKSFADEIGFSYLELQTDPVRNTTLAFVEVAPDGERAFTFARHQTADFNIAFDDIDFDKIASAAKKDGGRLSVLHIGSLMLSEESGRKLANQLVDYAKRNNIAVSFDVNFRTDIFGDIKSAVSAYMPVIEAADILKFSDDEVMDFTGEKDFDKAVARFEKPDRILAVTMGKAGSLLSFDGKRKIIPTDEKKAVDTVGAGDAFFGALLAKIDQIGVSDITFEALTACFEYANKIGAWSVTKHGAINRF